MYRIYRRPRVGTVGFARATVKFDIDRGVEDSISNLALYGTSFTLLARFEGGEDAVGADGTLVQAARDRVRALVAALSQPQPQKGSHSCVIIWSAAVFGRHQPNPCSRPIYAATRSNNVINWTS